MRRCESLDPEELMLQSLSSLPQGVLSLLVFCGPSGVPEPRVCDRLVVVPFLDSYAQLWLFPFALHPSVGFSCL